MPSRVTIGSYYQAINPNCQIRVTSYVGFYDGRHFYDVQLLDSKEFFPLTQNQILSGNFKIPSSKRIKEIYKGAKMVNRR